MSDDPLPGDEITEIVDVEAQADPEAVQYSADVVDLLDDGLKLVDGVPLERSFNGGLLLLTREGQDQNAFIFNVTENVSLTYLLGCLEVAKNSILMMIEEEVMNSHDEDEDASPPSA